MKKILVAGVLIVSTVGISTAAFAEEGPLPGGRPPCSIMHKTGSGIDGPLCTHPVPGT